jgi:hypothetical protein
MTDKQYSGQGEWKIPNPYGHLGWIAAIVTLFAWLFFMISSFKCFLTFSLVDNNKVYIGYWFRGGSDESNALRSFCTPWSAAGMEYFDGAWRFGKMLGVVGTIVGAVVIGFELYIIFYTVPTRIFGRLVFAHVFMSILSMLLLSGLASDICENSDCQFGPGAWLAIVDFFWWIGSALLVFKLRARSTLPEYEHHSKQRTLPTTITIFPPKRHDPKEPKSVKKDVTKHPIGEEAVGRLENPVKPIMKGGKKKKSNKIVKGSKKKTSSVDGSANLRTDMA